MYARLGEYTCAVTGMARTGTATIYLKLTGAEAEVKAVWAGLSGRRAKLGESLVTIGETATSQKSLNLAGEISYHTIRMSTGGIKSFIMTHPNATMRGPSPKFIIHHPDDKPDLKLFYAMLCQGVPGLPLMEDWAEELWTIGREKPLYPSGDIMMINAIETHGGVVAYQLHYNLPNKWAEVVHQILGIGGDNG